MTKNQVIAMMRDTKSEEEWNANVEKVKTCFNGKLPPFWMAEIIMSGIAEKAMKSWLK